MTLEELLEEAKSAGWGIDERTFGTFLQKTNQSGDQILVWIVDKDETPLLAYDVSKKTRAILATQAKGYDAIKALIDRLS